MRVTYAVVWREGDDPIASGSLEICARNVVFSGSADDGVVEREVPLDSLRTVHVGRASQDRLDGRPSLVLERRDGPLIRVAGVAQPGIVAELAQRLAGVESAREHTGCFLVVLPLREGALARARELVAAGPPFDPAEAGLLRHQVFLLEHEVVFAFEAPRDDERLHRLLGRPDLWAAAESWGELAAGPPSLSEGVFDWERVAQAGTNGYAGTLSFEPTPGPGDSEGGDLYAPVL